MESFEDKLENLALTNNDITNLTEALKKEEFRNLLSEYVDEVTSPEHRAQYEKEVTQIERERGIDIKFVHPDPGYVIKSAINGTTKAFINVCKNELVGKPSMNIQEDNDGLKKPLWNIPHLFSNSREDLAKNGQRCHVYDFLIHPDTYRLLETNRNFKKMIHNVIVDGLKKMLNVEVDEKNFRFPKLKYKGNPVASVIRKRLQESVEPLDEEFLKQFPDPYGQETTEERSIRIKQENLNKQSKVAEATDIKESKTTIYNKTIENETNKKNSDNSSGDSSYAKPKYLIKHQSFVDLQDYTNDTQLNSSSKLRPNKLVIEILLPLLGSANQIDLNFYEKRMLIVSENPAKYKLDIALPFPVDDSAGSAKFDKIKKKLTVTVPVIPVDESNLNSLDDDEWHHQNDQEYDEDDLNKTNKNLPKPLIEVISDNTMDEVKSLSHEDASTSLSELNESNVSSQNSTVSSASLLASTENYQMPVYKTFQNNDVLSIILEINNVKQELTQVKFLKEENSLLLFFVTMGDGGYPFKYQLCIRFLPECIFEEENIVPSFSHQNVVIKLMKKTTSRFIWQKYSHGVDAKCLKEAFFETIENLNNQLIIKDAETDVADKTNVSINVEKKQDYNTFTAEFKMGPKKHGILKLRSTSESSEESPRISLSSSLDSAQMARQISCQTITSEDEDGGLSSESSGFSGVKKSVSFSEQIDKTVYQTNQSVSMLHATLKNKKKKAIKKNQRQEQARIVRDERRRRRSSGSISMESSGGEESVGDAPLKKLHTLKDGSQKKSPGSPVKTRLLDRALADTNLNMIVELPLIENKDEINNSLKEKVATNLSSRISELQDNSIMDPYSIDAGISDSLKDKSITHPSAKDTNPIDLHNDKKSKFEKNEKILLHDSDDDDSDEEESCFAYDKKSIEKNEFELCNKIDEVTSLKSIINKDCLPEEKSLVFSENSKISYDQTKLEEVVSQVKETNSKLISEADLQFFLNENKNESKKDLIVPINDLKVEDLLIDRLQDNRNNSKSKEFSEIISNPLNEVIPKADPNIVLESTDTCKDLSISNTSIKNGDNEKTSAINKVIKNDTILSWEEGQRLPKTSKCNIQFSNSNIFELDND